MSAIGTFRLTLPGAMLQRGFWLYVWRVVRSNAPELLYVGRTGDNSSPNASAPYTRMGQHLGSLKNQNALRAHLVRRKISPDDCQEFELVAHGPIHPEISKPKNYRASNAVVRDKLMKLHLPLRDIVGAMEKRLAFELTEAGYDVMNAVKWRHDIGDKEWSSVRKAFVKDFPKLKAKTR
jgi:hypothetical protein